MRPADILQSYAIVMTTGLVLGLLAGGFPAYTKEISMVSLAVLMTLSLSTVRIGEARFKDHVGHSVWSLLLNYGALSILILAMGMAFSKELWPGWVLMAAAPSAISIVPFTSIFGGRTTKALFSTAVNYVAALALMPVMTILLIGSTVDVSGLVESLLVLIVIPMLASRAVAKIRLGKSTNTALINLSFAVLIFAVAGANRSAFFGNPWTILAISTAAVVRTFGSGLGTELALRKGGMPKPDRIAYVLFASYKNLGLTATMAIALFQPIVAVPATICIVFEVVWVIFLTRYYRGVSE
jgi:BASS family bile acid:Na+ symporter